MNLLRVCNRLIEYSFYGLFLLVPLVFTDKTSELFELNKMWITWTLTIIIGASWFTKMILQRRIIFQRTPLDIPIALFLVSQIISTIFSLDSHISFWGYYSRFNGGLLSTITYILLYYAFLSNFGIIHASGDRRGRDPNSAHLSVGEGALVGGKLLAGPDAMRMVKRLLSLSLISGLIVALWGLPSHFGFDPTCFLFRGSFDVSCWTADFQPKARIFSTLGQPNWLAAYLAILIPISIAMVLNSSSSKNTPEKKYQVSGIMYHVSKNFPILNTYYLILYTIFLLAFFYTRSQSGFFGLVIALAILFGLTLRQYLRPILITSLLFLVTLFIAGPPIEKFHAFSFEALMKKLVVKQELQNPTVASAQVPTPATGPALELNITSSGNIRSIVWRGALEAFKNNPLFGTGTETFAFAYYKYKLPSQNLTSEWNFLYNKAHNEYLNYLATTGIVGLGTYLGMIGFFLTIVILRLKAEGSQILRSAQNDKPDKTLSFALIASYVSILITNFFGFSVVITNIYLFMIPAFIFVLAGILKSKSETNRNESKSSDVSMYHWTFIFFIILASSFMLYTLLRFFRADIAYALGYNLNRAGEYQEAYKHLHKAVELRRDEPVFKDEMAINNALIVSNLLIQKDQGSGEEVLNVASTLAQEAINISNEIISQYQNNVLFWKSRVKLFYTLSQFDPRYLPRALDGIEKAALLAPQDANIFYNLGVLYGQNNEVEKGIETLEKVIQLKPDYRDAHYALGLFYHSLVMEEKALSQMQYILDHLSPQDPGALESIKNWSQ